MAFNLYMYTLIWNWTNDHPQCTDDNTEPQHFLCFEWNDSKFVSLKAEAKREPIATKLKKAINATEKQLIGVSDICSQKERIIDTKLTISLRKQSEIERTVNFLSSEFDIFQFWPQKIVCAYC